MESKERVISIEEGKVELKEFNSKGEINTDSLFPTDDKADWKSSEASLDWYGNTALPTLEIKESTIWVYHQAINGGFLRGTRLSGPNGNYYFTTANTSYNVVPGRYTHSIDGYIGGNNTAGRIASGIRYK